MGCITFKIKEIFNIKKNTTAQQSNRLIGKSDYSAFYLIKEKN